MIGGARPRWGPSVATLLLVAAASSCARIPPDRYGVRRLHLEGVEELDEDALRGCLASSERTRATITFGITAAGACGEPPFDGSRRHLKLWSWPWAEWPLLDRVMFQRDLARVERWYEARGFHGAKVVGTEVTPEMARESDVLDEEEEEPGCDRRTGRQGCTAELTIRVAEGEPTKVVEVNVTGHGSLPDALQERIDEAVVLKVGERFDEALYDRSKAGIARALASQGYVRAKVLGVARVHRPRREARVELAVTPGPACVFGEIRVEGAKGLPVEPIRAAALIKEGSPYRSSKVTDAERAIYGLGAFSAVVVEPVIPEEGNVVDLRVKVTPARRQRFGLGAGIQSGVVNRGDGYEQISVPEWDLHLLARYAHRNLFGGLRQLKIQERSRLIVQEPFPGFERPRFGNRLSIEFRQPGFLEPRLNLVLGVSHDFGPDPYDTFFRHAIDSHLSLRRSFWRNRFSASVGIGNHGYIVPARETTSEGFDPPSNSVLTFLEQRLRLDLRDDARRPHAGFFVQVLVQEGGYFLPSSWDYIRVLPDLRFYIPLPWGITIAGRFALGMVFITDSSGEIDEVSQILGPREHRLRGGGASGNRGFLPGRLGDGLDGGIRRWEASLELRFPVTVNFGVTLFGDMGDVTSDSQFRFDHPQTSVGLGLRYATIIGVLRLDFAWRIPEAQVFGEDLRAPGAGESHVNFGLFQFPGAVHFTIGEAF